jgi:hypothetical protein
MPEFEINNPRARAQRVAEAGGIQGSTALSQQIADADNFVRAQLGLPLIPILGLAEEDERRLTPDAGQAGAGQTLPRHTADP